MKTYIREKYNFNPIAFNLVSRQDHITPTLGISTSYLISVGSLGFQSGLGLVREIGGGGYTLTLEPDEYQPGPRLIWIPATTIHDSVYFRVNDVHAIEVAPIGQDVEAFLTFAMISGQDHISLAPRLAPTVEISRNGGSFQVNLGQIVEIGFGFYGIYVTANRESVIPNWNNECIYMLKATANGADVTYDAFQVFRYHQPA